MTLALPPSSPAATSLPSNPVAPPRVVVGLEVASSPIAQPAVALAASATQLAEIIDLEEARWERLAEMDAEKDLATIESLIAMWRARPGDVSARWVLRAIQGAS
jgi:hypothetical protein